MLLLQLPFAKKDLQRENNTLLDAVENTGVADVSAALSRQKQAMKAAVSKITAGDPDHVAIQLIESSADALDDLQQAVYKIVVACTRAGIVTAQQSVPFGFSIVATDWRLVDRHAQEFALDYSYELVTGITDTQRRGLSRALSAFIEDGSLDFPDALRPFFSDDETTRIIEALYNVDRAEMIAITETTRAYSEGKIRAYTAMGIVNQRPEETAPAHVRCRCDVRPVVDENGIWWWVWLTANDDDVCTICEPLGAQHDVGLARKPVDFDNLPPEQKALYEIEKSTVGASGQTVSILSSKGDTIFTKTAVNPVKSVIVPQIEFSDAEIALMENQVLTHNHPSGESFSLSDVLLARAGKLKEFRAVGNSYNGRWLYTMKPVSKFYSLPESYLVRAYNSAEATALRNVKGDTLVDKADVWHNTMKIMSSMLRKEGTRINYQRIPLNL